MNNFRSTPESSRRTLLQTVGERSVAIVLAGNSLSEFERRIEAFDGAPICYFGLNSFHVHEAYLLQKIDREFELVFVTWPTEFERQVDRIVGYLERDSSNLFITIRANVARLRRDAPDQHRRLAGQRSKVLFLEDLIPPDAFRIRHHVNSATMMLCSLIFSSCTGPIYILGMDAKAEPAAYYRQEQLESYRPLTQDFTSDVFCFTQNWRVLTGIMQDHGLSRFPPILNCNMDSGIDLFPKIAYDLFYYLVGGVPALSCETETALAKLDPIGPAGRVGQFPTADTLDVSLRRMNEALPEKEPW